MGSQPRPSETLAGFVRFCSHLRTEDGKPLRIRWFQRLLLAAYFRGVTETVIIIPTGNGKSTLLAALALYHAKCVEDAYVPITASSMEQASVLGRQAERMVERSGKEAGPKRYEIDGAVYTVMKGYRHIRCGTSTIQVIASNAAHNDGLIPTLALVDELHRHPNADNYGVLRDKIDKRGGRMVTISTAGWDLESPLGQIRARAYAQPSFTRKGCYNHASAPGFEFHEYCLTDGDDLQDIPLVKRANPAPWLTPAVLRGRRDSLSMRPPQWARYTCGIWTQGEEPWLQADVWDRMRVDIGGLEPGDDSVAAVVYGHGAALVVASPRDEEVAVGAWIAPEARFEEVEAHILQAAETYDLSRVAWCSKDLWRSAELLEQRGLPMAEYAITNSPAKLAVVTGTLRRLIDAGAIRHDGDPVLRQHVLGGATRDTQTGWKLVLTAETKAVAALAVAVHLATEIQPAPIVVLPTGVA